jgi:hypothetical protein
MNTNNFFKLVVVILMVTFFSSYSVNAQDPVGLISLNESEVFGGYTLFAPLFSKNTYLIDMYGNEVHSWKSDYKPGNSVYMLENGNILRTGKTSNDTVGENAFYAGGYGGLIQEIDWDGNVVWEYEYSTPEHRQHHDIEPLPNGNILFIAWQMKSYEEALEAGRNDNILTVNFWSDSIIEVNRDKEIVWEWHAWDHLSSKNGGVANGKMVSEDITDPGKININFINRERISRWQNPDFYSDWLHLNAIDYNADLDQIVIGSPHLDEFYVIDHSTADYNDPAKGIKAAAGAAGDIIYRWGNPKAYGSGGLDDQMLFGHHNIQWIEPGLPGAGNFLSFNNGFGRPTSQASFILEFNPPVSVSGGYSFNPETSFDPDDLVWNFYSSHYSPIISGAQRLRNGNTLICIGAQGRFKELTPDGEVVWEYLNPVDFNGIQSSTEGMDRNYVFRTERFAPDFPGFAGRDLSPGKPLEDIPTQVAQDESPAEFSVIQNYPNPFNLSTSIEFTIHSMGFTSLDVYNVMGQNVRGLVSSDLTEGKHAVVWDGKDNFGNTVPTGFYITRLENNEISLSSRMLLVK